LKLIATSCQFKNNRLVGHTYIIKPINEAVRLKLEFSSAQITHTYVSNSDVNVVTYINGEPTKTEDLSYSFDGSTYKMDDEVYNVVFKGDTVVLSVDSTESSD
jgi:hypothetical protein